jgi:hypothetical protein
VHFKDDFSFFRVYTLVRGWRNQERSIGGKQCEAASVGVRFWQGATRTATFQCSSLLERRRVPRCACCCGTMTPCVSSTMWRARKNLWNSPMSTDGLWSASRTIGGRCSRSKSQFSSSRELSGPAALGVHRHGQAGGRGRQWGGEHPSRSRSAHDAHA